MKINIASNEVIHFIGIGGIGMSGLAQIMSNMGFTIQGSDLNPNKNTERLIKSKIKVHFGHNKKNLKKVTMVVTSSAIKKNNKELVAAEKKKLPVFKRGEMLANIVALKKNIVIAGAHGKTTTTSLVANILVHAGLDPTVINGGIINSLKNTAKFGKGEWMVVEADESDGSFLKLPHEISIITNLDIEHLDYYKTLKSLYSAFDKFIMNLPFYGISIVNADDRNLKKIIKQNDTRKIISFSKKNKKASVFIKKISFKNQFSCFTLKFNIPINNLSGSYSYKIKAIGLHNVYNGVASIIAGLLAGVKNSYIREALINYIGVKRRFTHLGNVNLSNIYDDYAHHPTEISATLSGAKQINKNIIVVFQPHRYSRTKILFNDFVNVLSKIKSLYLLETYSAGEKK